jgi:Lipase (class 3)
MTIFDQKLARSLLEICRYTYAAGFDDALNAADKKDALKWIEEAGELAADAPTILRANRTSVACVVPYVDKNVVAYMGTKTQFNTPANAVASTADWFQNVEAPQVPFRFTPEQLGTTGTRPRDLGGRVHAGFLEELAAVQGLVVAELMKRGGKTRPLYVTGHSQGGAEAALATPALLAGGFNVAETYTFAAPRPGNAEFAATVPSTFPVHRIEFGDDIVPHVPPMALSRGLRRTAGLLRGALGSTTNRMLDSVLGAGDGLAFRPLGKLCYGSNKTRALRVDLSAKKETELFLDRLWSLARHPERWAEHHHLAGTSAETGAGRKGNYTALVSEFELVDQ